MRHTLSQRWIVSVIGVLLLAFLLFPVYWMINVSLQAGKSAVAVSWFPTSVDFAGYTSALGDQAGNLGTSLLVAVGAVAICLIVATPAAYALSHFRLRGSATVTFAILISQMIPGIVIANALYSAYNDIGLLNSHLGLILADASLGIPFSILIMRAFMSAIPPSIIEAARVDGAGRLRAFTSIVVPVSRNAVITSALFTFLFAWSDFLFALTLTTTEEVRPVTLGIYQYIGGHVADWPAVMATAVLASIPAAVLLIAAQKYVASGVTGGAVK